MCSLMPLLSMEFLQTQEEADRRCYWLVRSFVHIYFVIQYALFTLACSFTRGLFFSDSGLFLSPVCLFEHECTAPSPCERRSDMSGARAQPGQPWPGQAHAAGRDAVSQGRPCCGSAARGRGLTCLSWVGAGKGNTGHGGSGPQR